VALSDELGWRASPAAALDPEWPQVRVTPRFAPEIWSAVRGRSLT